MSRPWIVSSLSGRHSSTEPFHSSSLPAERSEANGTTSAAGKSRSASTPRIVDPTSAGGAQHPDSVAVAAHPPRMTGTAQPDRLVGIGARPVGSSGRTASAPSSKAWCSALHRVGDAVGGDHAGDLDRRGGDHLDVDPLAAEHLEDLGGDAGVGAHAGADDRDLADPLVGADALADLAEARRSCRSPWSGRSGRR